MCWARSSGCSSLSLIQSLIQFNQGQLSSWWTSIFIGLLMLLFIGVQSVLATAQYAQRLASTALGWSCARPARAPVARPPARGRSRRGDRGLHRDRPGRSADQRSPRHQSVDDKPPVAAGCTPAAGLAPGQAADLQAGGRGHRVRADRRPRLHRPAVRRLSRRASRRFGWNAAARGTGHAGGRHRPRGQPRRARVGSPTTCTRPRTTPAPSASRTSPPSPPATAQDHQAVDGGTDAPAKYWLATSRISAILPKFGAARDARDRGPRSTARCRARACWGAALAAGGLWLYRHTRGAGDTDARDRGGRMVGDGHAVQAAADGLHVDVVHPERHR